MVVHLSYLAPIPCFGLRAAKVSQSLTMLLSFLLAYLVSPTVAALTQAVLSLGLLVGGSLFIGCLAFLAFTVHDWLCTGRALSP